MPEEESTSWLTVPLGLTQVIAQLGPIPRRSAHSRLVSFAHSLSSFKSIFPLNRSGLSAIPVRETPRSLSSSVFFCQILRRYLKFVKVDWIVPRIVASLTFRLR